MELSAWASVFAVVFTTVVYLGAVHARRRRPCNSLPGPKPWPIIGNFNLLGALPHRSLDALSKRHGPLMRVQFGSFPVVIASSVDMAKFFLKTHDSVFIDRPKMAAGKYTTYNYSNIAWSPYGAYWRQARKICADELFSARRLESFEHVRQEEVHALLRTLHGTAGQVVPLKECLSTMSLNIITRMVLGRKCVDKEVVASGGGSVTTWKEFRWMLDELFLLNGVLNIGDWIPWLSWLDLQGYVRRMKRVGRMFNQFMENVVEEHNERRLREGDAFVPQDMVDRLLQLADDPSLDVKLTRDSVKAFTQVYCLCTRKILMLIRNKSCSCLDSMAQDLVAGGTESAAVIVEWAISELLKNPDVFAKATEELDGVIGRDRWVTEDDIPHLPYMDAIVKETMRLHMVAPLLSPRLSREDTSVGGYDIPAGTRVLINAWTISRDPALWDAPEEFRPERFVGSKIDVKGQDFELLPFGSGRRMCPGYSLGLKVIQVTLVNLLHGFAWRLPDGMTEEELSMEEVFGLSTPRKFPLQAVVEPKLPARMYTD
jgi:cytochrome P450